MQRCRPIVRDEIPLLLISLGSGHGDNTIELDYGGRVIKARQCLADQLPADFTTDEVWREGVTHRPSRSERVYEDDV